MNDFIMINDADWFTTPRGWRDVIRCLRGRHKAVTVARSASTGLVQRCSCGAIQFDRLGWMESRPFTLRREEPAVRDALSSVEGQILERAGYSPDVIAKHLR